MKSSLLREIGELRRSMQRMETRLDEIAAAMPDPSRLAEWSAAREASQREIARLLRRPN